VSGNGDTPLVQLTAKDFKSDQEVRWCPGCGDYAILAAMQQFMPELGIPRERIVFVSGIGCAARFPYYMQTYGMHSIHGRAPAIATGLSSSRPDLSVWVVTGDGDALSIGGNHLIHALRRNVNFKILLFNNQIYGLTKGQYSPTSPLGTHNKTTPFGSLDTDKKHLTEVLRRGADHKGSVFIEIYQNCNVYNDGAFDAVRAQKENRIDLKHGEPIRFGGEDGTVERGVVSRPDGGVEIVDVASVGEDALLRHDERAEDSSLAYALSRLSHTPVGPTPIGIFRAVERPVYDAMMAEQIEVTKRELGEGDLEKLLHAGDTWEIAS
jgi:2-oxoglutarate ferredoxin oxidoreductase subunit beta